MLGYTFAIENQNSDIIVLNNYTEAGRDDSYIVLTEYPQFDVEVRNAEIAKEGQHGVWDFYSFYGKRVINFTGQIVGVNEPTVNALKAQLERVVSLPAQPTTSDDGSLLVSWIDYEGRAVEINAKLMSSIKFARPLADKRTLRFNMTLKAVNPFIQYAELILDNGFRGYEMGSIRMPFKMSTHMPFVKEQILEVENGGSVQTESIIKLYGGTFGITNPRITNLTTGKFMQVNTTLVDATKYIILNSKSGVVSNQDGDDLSSMLTVGSEFIKLSVGVNQLFYTSNENSDSNNPITTRITPNEVLNVSHKDQIV